MKKCIFITFFLFISLAFSLNAEKNLQLSLKKITEVGKRYTIFYQVVGVCEDDRLNFYVLDYKAYKVYKFSPDGKPLFSFGSKGEGPGCFRYPRSVFFSTSGEIIVTETTGEASTFDRKGKILQKNNFSYSLGRVSRLKYAGSDLFYGEKSTWNRLRKQLLFNSKGEIKNESLFTHPPVNILRGRGMYVKYSNSQYTTTLLFDYFNKHSAVAISNKYEILILDEKGEKTGTITRNIPPAKITRKEKDYLVKDIKAMEAPPDVKSTIIFQIPDTKNCFHKLLVSEKYLFVILVNEDISNKGAPNSVDIFELSGQYVGNVKMENIPFLISGRYMYFSETSGEDMLVVKYGYELTPGR